MDNSEIYLKAVLSMIARQTFPPERLQGLVGRGKQIEAYNLCDGTRTQADVRREVGLDHGNFSRTVSRWVELGILLKVADNKDIRPLHLYPLPTTKMKDAPPDA